MQRSGARAVLAFYAPEEHEQAQRAYSTIHDGGDAARIIGAEDSKLPASCKFYASLRIGQENLVAVETDTGRVSHVVTALRHAGTPSVFVTAPQGRKALRSKAKTSGAETADAKSRREILKNLERDQHRIESARRELREAARLQHALPPAAEWILDNSYLARTHIAELRRLLPRDLDKWLVPKNGLPGIPALAGAFVRECDFAVSEASMREFLARHVGRGPRTIAELWSFPLFVRIALIEDLAGIAARVARTQQVREAAYLWANRLTSAAHADEDEFRRVLGLLESEPAPRDPHFATAIAEQLQDEERVLPPVQRWLEERLHSGITDIARELHTREAAQAVSTANAFGSLRMLAGLSFAAVFEAVSPVDTELRKDPSGVFPRSHFSTRDLCRRVVEGIARRSHTSEVDIARAAVGLTGRNGEHVPYYLLSGGLSALEKEVGATVPLPLRAVRAIRDQATVLYIGSILVLTFCFAALAAFSAMDIGAPPNATLLLLTILASLPLSELALQIVNILVVTLLPPEPLACMDFREGIPAEDATLVVVPMMLSSADEIRSDLEKLEIRYLSNRNENLYYSLFGDFVDAPEPSMPADAGLFEAARAGIADLNARYPLPEGRGDRFLLFHRPRVWSDSEQGWIGRERKRGKLADLNAYLCGGGSPDILAAGRLTAKIAFVITLDSDTQLPIDAARRLIETIAHPLNRVEIDPATRARGRGYSVIQPRVSIALPGATATRFTRVFAGVAGNDPYSRTISDLHQDLFREAMFHGKAIYDVRAFHEILRDRFPDETILSHDLIEGAHTGVGLATDIELFEHLPVNYASYSQREHRWIRGDWQIAPWIMPWVPSPNGRGPNPLSMINRWRVFDNLRRSLIRIAAVATLLAGWFLSDHPALWSAIVALSLAMPAVAPLLDRLARKVEGTVQRWQGSADELARTVVTIAFLPHQAWVAADAILRALHRRYISRRKLLEWRTAALAHAESRIHIDITLRRLIFVAGSSAALGALLLMKHALLPAAPFLALWMVSPLLMIWLSQPERRANRHPLKEGERDFLRILARRTWRFFDDLISAERHWLPPDNQQLAIRVEIAERTSPTNIGLGLVAVLAARDFGYLTVDDFLRRIGRTLGTLHRLERYEGHLFNWYDTKTLEPLNPRYVSTVDSGNLLACLWVLEQGIQDAIRAPLMGATAIRGLNGTLSALEEACAGDSFMAPALRSLSAAIRRFGRARELAARFRTAQSATRNLRRTFRWSEGKPDRTECAYWTDRLDAELSAWLAMEERYLGWMGILADPPDHALREIDPAAPALRRRALRGRLSLAALAGAEPTLMDSILEWRSKNTGKELAAWLDELAAEYGAARARAAETMRDCGAVSESIAALASGIDMRFLYDERAKLFGIGYSVGGPREFNSHYALLASECRLTSLVAIAKGDVPAEHWHAMSRPFTKSRHGEALLSWSGTMFEYLMPLIFTRSFENSLLDRACRDAVLRQVEYGNANGIPWGISESGYSAIDAHGIYQYRAFGVPALALDPSADADLVVAPYATVMAIPIDASAASANLSRLSSHGMLGPSGYFEAIDFMREREREGERGVVIQSYMAHHQGMSFAALDNYFHRNVLQRRLHNDLRIRAVETLLFEGIPIVELPIEEVRMSPAPVRAPSDDSRADRVWTEETAVPRVCLFGNGRMAAMVTNSGGAYLRWHDFDISRWRPDAALDSWGTFVCVRDVESNELWGTTHKPFIARKGESSIRFAADRAEYRRRLSGIESVLEITLAEEDDAEIRRLRVTNRSLRKRRLELTSYLELAMAPHDADKAHPAFAKMFIETEFYEPSVLVARRRPRSPGEPAIWTAHILAGATATEFETDRLKFLGRGHGVDKAAALRAPLTGSAGTVIDPIFSLRCLIELEPRERKELAFITIAAASREVLMNVVNKYLRPESASRAFEMAWNRAQLVFRFLGIRPGDAHRYEELASQLLYPNPRLRPSPDRIARNQLGQQALWAHSLSGDLPIVVVTIAESRNMGLVRDVLVAHYYWRLRGFRADLVILNLEGASYDAPLRQQLQRLIEAHASDVGNDKPGGVYLRDWNVLPEDQQNLILAAASIVLSGNRGSLQQQLAPVAENAPAPPLANIRDIPEEPSPPLPFLHLPYFNGLGGFSEDGREYAVYLAPGSATPKPWANVIANPAFGTLVTESGLGFTWAGNSQSNRITPWRNDPVRDPQGEVVYLRDEETGRFWTPTALPIRENDAHRARHGQGYTVFEHNSHAIEQELTVFVPVRGEGEGDPVKICRLRLTNRSSRNRRLTATFFAELVLGAAREDQQLRIQTSRDDVSGALVARQFWTGAWRGQYVFAASAPGASSWSTDRTQFLGRNSSYAVPAALKRARLDNRAQANCDSAFVLQTPVSLAPGERAEITFLLGQTADREKMRELIARYREPAAVEGALRDTRNFWDAFLGAVQVKTGILSVDFLLNRWLPYQALSCRFWGRSAVYQSGGAFGYRDQLQDCLAFVYGAPKIARAHILLCASRQFTEGDVQHWWHPETGNGVRTLCSDDFLWLPYAAAHYVDVTGDTSIMDERVAFLEGPALEAGEHERMFIPAVSPETAPLSEHCRRALDHGSRFGAHGLPLMGSGDWNDGMNLVGVEGKGESVWLAWFLYATMEKYPEWSAQAAELKKRIETAAWDGDWYLRAFFDNGAPLGSHVNEEARIDSLSQSWAVISGAGDPARARRAMESAEASLVREQDRLVLLFTPPFDHSAPNPGYIMGYPPGLRENGGQYTHGSLWLALAWAMLGDGQRAAGLLQLMNPAEHPVARYGGEPYVAAADVYSAPGRVGECGWTWYTGSAAWMYRVWVEAVLGFRKRGDQVTVTPLLEGAEVKWRG